ncbi:MAG: phosphate acyltransferase [Desulfomonilia bacterium]
MRALTEFIHDAAHAVRKPRLLCVPAEEKRILSVLPDVCNMVQPVLVGNKDTIHKVLASCGVSPGEWEIIHEPDRIKACERALELSCQDSATIVMESGKGSLLQEILKEKRHTRWGIQCPAHITVVDDRAGGQVFMVADTLMHPRPDLKNKEAILNTALAVARILGAPYPKVAALAALEYVNHSIQSTVDAAVLSKMAERNQFGEAFVEGPLDIDCAVSRDACTRKKVKSIITGEVDLFLVSDVESGQCFLQFLSFFGRMELCGIVAGYPSPLIVTMPYDTVFGRIAAVALSCRLCGYAESA